MKRLVNPLGCGVLFALTVLSGVWLSQHGDLPYHTGVLTIHKLLAFVTVVIAGFLVLPTLLTSTAFLPWALLGVLCISAVALFSSGALMSMDRPYPAIVNIVHRLSPVSGLLATIALVRLTRDADVSESRH